MNHRVRVIRRVVSNRVWMLTWMRPTYSKNWLYCVNILNFLNWLRNTENPFTGKYEKLFDFISSLLILSETLNIYCCLIWHTDGRIVFTVLSAKAWKSTASTVANILLVLNLIWVYCWNWNHFFLLWLFHIRIALMRIIILSKSFKSEVKSKE